MKASCLLLLLLPGVISQDVSPCSANDEECMAQAEELSVSLFQRSLAIVPGDGNTNLESGQSLQEKLHVAKQARLAMDKHIASLESQLANVEAVALGQSKGASLQTPPTLTDPLLYGKSIKNARMGVLSLIAVIIIIYMARIISAYEASRDAKEVSPPWYLDTATCKNVLSAGGFLWLLCGMIAFTEFMWFLDDARHLTMVESLYVTAQIVTTVGYGDMTPNTDGGKVFMAFYALTGVGIIGSLISQILADTLAAEEEDAEEEKTPLFGKYQDIVVQVMPLFLCLAFGTLFYSLYPGEDKTMFEAFYMSMITLLTIGFGAYHPVTQVGKLVGALWMLVGVVVMGSAICSATDYIKNEQAKLQTQARSLKLFREIDTDGSGTIDKMEFLNYEIVRQGLPNKTLESATAMFEKLDADRSGTLDLKEFQAYVMSSL